MKKNKSTHKWFPISDLKKINKDYVYIYTDIDRDTPKTNSKNMLKIIFKFNWSDDV